jgi:hypothetical protein
MTFIIGIILLANLIAYSQNIYKKYTNVALEQTKILSKLLEYSERLTTKERDKFHSEFYAVFHYLTTPQFANERYAFQINMLYYGEDDLTKRKTELQITKEVDVFIERKDIAKFADYFIKLLEIVINGTTIKKNTPIEIINTLDSFKKEYVILKQLSTIN